MSPSELEFYHSLHPDEQTILQIASIMTNDNNVSDISRTCQKYAKYHGTQKPIENLMEKAVDAGLFKKIGSWGGSVFLPSAAFLLFIFPKLGSYKKLLKNQSKESYYYADAITRQRLLFRNCLYGLLYDHSAYTQHENKYLETLPSAMAEDYGLLLHDPAYDASLPLLSQAVLEEVCLQYGETCFNELQPLAETEAWMKSIAVKTRKNIWSIKKMQWLGLFWTGSFGYLANLLDDKEEVEINGVEREALVTRGILANKAVWKLIVGSGEEALPYFTRYLKIDKIISDHKTPWPASTTMSFFYLLAILSSPKDVAAPLIRKMCTWGEKHRDNLRFFQKVCLDTAADFINEGKNEAKESAKALEKLVIGLAVPGARIIELVVYYLLGRQVDEKRREKLLKTVEQAADAGYTVLAYEAAYVLKAWDEKDEEGAKLYARLEERCHYTPVVARILRPENWEKQLEQLLSLGARTKAEKRDSVCRLIYRFYPRMETIVPVLQTRNAKGSWSKGRIIALKRFYDGDVEGMLEQDRRIAQHVTVYNGYSPWSKIQSDVFKDLVGHPYVFLEETEVKVEFVAATPQINVKKSGQGYRVSVDVPDNMEDVFIEKETNTRYKVYVLTVAQRRLIDILKETPVILPEKAKDRLPDLLGVFTQEGMSVQSDQVGIGSSAQIREVEPDTRVRIQLLPYGDGLKAELFSKPFGTCPPYCKPGKGGKVLIAPGEEEGVQLQVKRDLQAEAEHANALMEEIQQLESLQMDEGLIEFDEPLDSLQLLDIAARHADTCVVEWPEGERFRLKGTAYSQQMSLNIRSGINWFELEGELRVDEKTVLGLQQLLSLTATSKRGFIEVQPGEFMALGKELRKQLETLRLFSSEEKGKVHLNKFAAVGLEGLLNEMGNVNTDRPWQDFCRRVEEAGSIDRPVPASLQAELRNYQMEGFRWMSRLAAWGAGACLADEMGLGKTLQSLAVLLDRAQEGPGLVVCPVSVLGNWASEAERFAPTLRVKTLPSMASGGRQEVMDALEAGDLLITSYGILQSEEERFASRTFATIVLDEAHVIKNFATKTSKATMKLQGAFRIALTGTPIQNHLSELWNLFHFINPGLLGSLKHFNDTFIKPGEAAPEQYLKKLIAPFILRRTKAAVLDELPPKTEVVRKITLSEQEMAFYEALRRQALVNLEGSSVGGRGHIQALAEITRLRQACCNPLLIDSHTHIPSSKLQTFLGIVDELLENHHRALVFSQFVTHLSILRKALDERGISYQYLDGSTSQHERQRQVKAFQDGASNLFLISLKAGGLGLNLTGADFVIHMDPWWNPAAEDQASDRAHRIGQTRPVTIYRLVAEGTIEEKIIQLHNRKRDMADSLLEGSDKAANLSLDEIIGLIKAEI
ncbi:MAG: DEAD/DEAH box helicase [Tannerella sp.]|jgi:superfamily II DNA or RNA helicase|nr:DEAD/DEAH box helicase [Tannerella sp.]